VLLEVSRDAKAFDSVAAALSQISRCANSYLIHLLIQQRRLILLSYLLVSEESALHIVRQRMSETIAAQYYGCTTAVIKFRLNMTGALRRIRN
jgi:hypothetical protein